MWGKLELTVAGIIRKKIDSWKKSVTVRKEIVAFFYSTYVMFVLVDSVKGIKNLLYGCRSPPLKF